MKNSQEQKFIKALRDVFIGAKIEGQSGYVNLMHIKSRYFESIFPVLMSDIDAKLKGNPDFREEMFEKLYFFFSRYFNETGSIYFNYTPLYQNIYDKVYDPNRDVILFWKTHMLYYVKSEAIYKSMTVEVEGINFYFDASQIENKKNNERRDLIFEFDKVEILNKKSTILFKVNYSQRGRLTKIDEILKSIKKEEIKNLTEEILDQSFSIFKKQSEVDFFINKNAKEFLREQFDLYVYQYMFKEINQFDEKRIKELQSLKEIAYNIISFISQFEDELVKIWNKPKFPLGSNYVITLDRLSKEIVEKIIKHEGIKEQIAEWKQLGIVKDKFKPKEIIDSQTNIDEKDFLTKEYKSLPIDTKYFKDLELEILSLFQSLDDSLDGTLIHSENYQALNTLRRKYKGTVKTIYIDPPFNLDSSDQFVYRTNYKDANWATLLENRISIAKDFLSKDGSIFVRCDYNGNYLIRFLLDQIFTKDNFRNEIVVNRFKRQLDELKRLNFATEVLFYYAKSDSHIPNKVYRSRTCTFCGKEMEPTWRPMSSPGIRLSPITKENVSLFSKSNVLSKNGKVTTQARIINGSEFLPPSKRHWTFNQDKIFQLEKENRIRLNNAISYTDNEGKKYNSLPEYLQTEDTPIDTSWNDLKGYAFAAEFSTENAEELLKRTIDFSSNINEFVIDFFMGSATTQAVAHKLGRKWLGIEMGDHFFTVVLPRMKKVLSGVQSGISKEVDFKGGGFFKYFSLEQYEDTLQKASYKDDELLIFNENKSPYEQYIFMRDDKLTDKVLKLNYKDKTVKVTLNKLYPNIDVAETLSLITGKKIKKITTDEVEFIDGTKESITNPNYHLLKEIIWW